MFYTTNAQGVHTVFSYFPNINAPILHTQLDLFLKYISSVKYNVRSTILISLQYHSHSDDVGVWALVYRFMSIG